MMKKLRIAVWHNLPSGGGKRQLYYHVKGLIERGHYVESWCPDTADQTFLPLGSLIKENILPLEAKSADYGIIRTSRNEIILQLEGHRAVPVVIFQIQKIKKLKVKCFAQEVIKAPFFLRLTLTTCMTLWHIFTL